MADGYEGRFPLGGIFRAKQSFILFKDQLAGRRVNGELFLASYFKTSYFGELFVCKLDDSL